MRPPSEDPPLKFFPSEVRSELERELLVALRRDADALLALNSSLESVQEDGVYRFFHQSHKVFRLQHETKRMMAAFQALLPDVPLNPWLVAIVEAGNAKVMDKDTNSRWLAETRPVVEAFLVTKQVLDMVCKYARAYEEPPQVFDPGWGTVLYLFMLR